MQIVEGLDWVHIYWVRGALPKTSEYKNYVSDPPCAGWQHALVLRGEKRSTIFCPYSFNTYMVPNHAAELMTAEEPKVEFRMDVMHDLIVKNWTQMQGWGWQRDYDMCASVLRKLDLEVPAQVQTGGGEDNRRKGGKPAGPRLIKVIKASGKRGKFLQWFLDNEGVRSLREAMAEFEITRSNALSYLYMLNKDHGIGYELIGDTTTVTLPRDGADPFGRTPDDDDDWLDAPETPAADDWLD